MGDEDERRETGGTMNLVTPPEWRNKSPPDYSPPAPSWLNKPTSLEASLSSLTSALLKSSTFQQTTSLESSSQVSKPAYCTDNNCNTTDSSNLSEPNTPRLLSIQADYEPAVNPPTEDAIDFNSEPSNLSNGLPEPIKHGVLVLLEYLDKCSTEMKIFYNMFRKLSDMERAHAKEMLKYSEGSLALKECFTHKTVSDIICELISTIKIVARDKLRHSEELSKCCDNILKLSKFAKSKYRYNRNLFKPEQKMMYDSVLQLNKAKTRYNSSVNDLESASGKGKRGNVGQSQASGNRLVMSFLFKQPDVATKLEEARLKANNLFDVYKEKLEQTTECSEVFFKVQIPAISKNLQRSVKDFGVSLTHAIGEIAREFMTQPEKEVCFLSKNSVSLSKRLEDVDVQKDFEMFVMRPHNVPSISHAQKIDSSPYSPKATKALMLYGQDSTPLLPRCLFGQSLETLIEQENCEVPALVTRCIQYVEENALDTVGIYRIPGSAKKLRAYIAIICENVDEDIDSVFNDGDLEVHAVAGLLKTFFRELPEALVPISVIEDINEGELSIETLKESLLKMPRTSTKVFKCIVGHLRKVSDNSSINQMTCDNLAMIWSQTLIDFGPNDEISQVVAVGRRCSFLKSMILNYEAVFECEP